MYDIFLTSQNLYLDLNHELYNREGFVLGINPFSQHCFPEIQIAKDCWQKTISHHIEQPGPLYYSEFAKKGKRRWDLGEV